MPLSVQRRGSARKNLSRSGVEPPTGTIHPRQISPAIPNPERHFPEMNLLIDSCFPSAIPLLSRGWSFPVGGSTPDRHRSGLSFPSPLPSATLCGLSRSGVEPPTGTIHPRQISPAIPNPERHFPEMNLLIDSCFPPAVPLLSRGWSFPVGGSTPDRHRSGLSFPSPLPSAGLCGRLGGGICRGFPST